MKGSQAPVLTAENRWGADSPARKNYELFEQGTEKTNPVRCTGVLPGLGDGQKRVVSPALDTSYTLSISQAAGPI